MRSFLNPYEPDERYENGLEVYENERKLGLKLGTEKP
jgi:hypothetical protein